MKQKCDQWLLLQIARFDQESSGPTKEKVVTGRMIAIKEDLMRSQKVVVLVGK